jgi:predicted RND superfamily exporter protein
LALTAAAAVPALRLRIDTDLTSLLPDGAPAAEDYRTFLRTFGGFEKVFVLVRAPGVKLEDPEPLLAAAERLAERMAASPLVAEARAGLTERDERFFFGTVAPRLPLLVDGAAWRADLARRLTPPAIHERVGEMRRALRGPLGAIAGRLFVADPLGLSPGLLSAATSSLPIEPVSGGFLSRDGRAALVVLTPARAEIDPEGGRALLADLGRAYRAVRAESGLPLDFRAIGGPVYAAQDEAVLKADLVGTSAGTTLGLALVLILGFEGLAIPAAVLAAVTVGVIWTVAGGALALGSLSGLSAGFLAALLGMGVDYTIHLLARLRELRLAGVAVVPALVEAVRETGPGITSAALTTTAALVALGLAHFRLLREVGLVMGFGALATLAATATLGAAPAAAFPRWFGGFRPLRLWPRFGEPALAGLAAFASRRSRPLLVATALLSAFSLWGLTRLTFNADPRALRPADHPALLAERLLVQEFAVGLDTLSVVVRGRDLDAALDRAALVRRLLATELGPAAEITAPSDWLIRGERLRRRLDELRALPLAAAADRLEAELAAAGFRVEPFRPAVAALRAMGRGEDPGQPAPADWPRWMSELVREAPSGAQARELPEGALRKELPSGALRREPPREVSVAVHVRLPLGRMERIGFERLARRIERIVPGHTALAAVPRVGAELRQLALSDLRRASVVAGLLVAIVVLVSFRGRPGDSLLSALPLTLGCLWTFGLWGAARGSIDLLCVFVVPLLLGTGIDLGVHAVHWRRQHPREGFQGAAGAIGLALSLATLTTVVGFGSLFFSRVPGLRHSGVLVAVGLSACLLATVTVLPAWEAFRRDGAPVVGE